MKSAKSSKKPAKKPAKRPQKPAAAVRSSARSDLKIKALSDPPKEGSLGRQHWDQAIGKIVSAYLGQFDQGKARRTAAQWLSNWLGGKGARVELV
jgi:hypothetical protein